MEKRKGKRKGEKKKTKSPDRPPHANSDLSSYPRRRRSSAHVRCAIKARWMTCAGMTKPKREMDEKCGK